MATRTKGKFLPLIAQYQKKPSNPLREKIIGEHINFVRFIARRFLYRGEPLEDLVQVGIIGLMKAIDRYRNSFRTEFTTYAAPLIIGEIKHYLRDESSAVKVPRKLQELNTLIKKHIIATTQKKGRSPTVKEIAKEMGLSEETILEAMEAGQSYNTISLDKPIMTEDGGSYTTVAETLLSSNTEKNNGLDPLVEVENIRRAMATLPKREKEVIRLRFFQNLQQMDIAKELKISQVHVSRILALALRKIKRLLTREDKEDKIYHGASPKKR